MKYGVVLPIWRLSVPETETMALRAEAFGFDAVFVPDHILAKPATTEHYGPSWPDPFSLLAYLAGRAPRIQVGASVIVLPYRNPLVTAKAAATVDQVSGGRFIFGIGVGWDEAEFKDLSLPFRERGAMADEYLRMIKAAWTSDVPSFSGHYLSFGGATFAPRPLQKPHPPIWAGGSPGTLSAPAMRRAAELCDAWHPLNLGWADLERGIATVRELAARAGRKAAAVSFAPRNLLGFTTEARGSGRAPFEGSPDQVAADVRRAAALGCDWITFDMPRADVAGMVAAIKADLTKEVPWQNKPGGEVIKEKLGDVMLKVKTMNQKLDGIGAKPKLDTKKVDAVAQFIKGRLSGLALRYKDAYEKMTGKKEDEEDDQTEWEAQPRAQLINTYLAKPLEIYIANEMDSMVETVDNTNAEPREIIEEAVKSPNAKETLMAMMYKNPVSAGSVIQNIDLYQYEPYAEEVMIAAAEKNPAVAFAELSNHPEALIYAKTALIKAAEAMPTKAAFEYMINYMDQPYAGDMLLVFAESGNLD